jgi:acetyltransferase-like isoleucine patch superfamily enzyme
MQPDRTEKQKMLAGELYWAADTELVAERRRAARLTREYNATTEEEVEQRSHFLQELFGQVGSKIYIEPPFRCDHGSNIYSRKVLPALSSGVRGEGVAVGRSPHATITSMVAIESVCFFHHFFGGDTLFCPCIVCNGDRVVIRDNF